MRCPFCNHTEGKVVDSRASKEGDCIRRRRECLKCGRRFTTYERIEEVAQMVIKKDGRRENFDRWKLKSGILKAVEKRPVSLEQVDALIDEVERDLFNTNEHEVTTKSIGEVVMSCPPSAILPPRWRVTPTMVLSSVVLPVPLRPSTASARPSPSVRSMPEMTSASP